MCVQTQDIGENDEPFRQQLAEMTVWVKTTAILKNEAKILQNNAAQVAKKSLHVNLSVIMVLMFVERLNIRIAPALNISLWNCLN